MGSNKIGNFAPKAMINKDNWLKFRTEPFAVFWCPNWMVQIHLFNEINNIIRITVNNLEINTYGDWDDDICWEDLYAIKNGLGYQDSDAVEFYPPKNDLVHVANMRHLWVLPYKLDFVWRPSLEAPTPAE